MDRQAIIDAVIKEIVKAGGRAVFTFTNEDGSTTDFSWMEANKSKELSINWKRGKQ